MSHEIVLKIGAEHHPWAECLDCRWEMDESSQTRDVAKRHARNAGHKVKIVKSHVSVWGPALQGGGSDG